MQQMITLLDKVQSLANGASVETDDSGIPCIGYTLASGMIYSSQAVTLTIEQGCKEDPGAVPDKIYRQTTTVAVGAGATETFQVPIVGKFIKAKIANASGFASSIEVWAFVRGYE